ncbi:MAG: hypothetical protein ACOCZ5_00685 [bacterium]
MSTITISKTIPTSSTYGAYTSGGNTTITLQGVDKLTGHTKKELQKIPARESPQNWKANPSDRFRTLILDLKKGDDEITIDGTVEDDNTTTAWEKIWKLRAMCASGGPLSSLTIDNITINGISTDMGTLYPYLEEVTWEIEPHDLGSLDELKGDGVIRATVSLHIYMGVERESGED